MAGEPFSKERQLARGERRYRRKVASPKQWQAIIAAKQGPCRICKVGFIIQYHHLVPRIRGGADIADNIVPLCTECHRWITLGRKTYLELLRQSLTEAERAYIQRQS